MEQGFIAERRIWAVSGNERAFEIRLAVGMPYRISEGDWACPTQLMGLHDKLADIHGIDSWQALQLAQGLLAWSLGKFVENGGRLFWEKDGEEVRVESIFVGIRAA